MSFDFHHFISFLNDSPFPLPTSSSIFSLSFSLLFLPPPFPHLFYPPSKQHHFLTSGLVNPRCAGFIGSGVVVHVPSFFAELDTLEKKGLNCDGRLFISDRAHLVFDFHQVVDGLKEVELGGSSIGTTKKGIGPAYSSKASRSGLRVHHLYDHELFASKFRKLVEGRFKRYGHFEYDTEGEIARYKAFAERLRPHIVDGVTFIHEAISQNRRVLVEGANALMLDLDFGTYPFVTSSSTSIGGVCTGLGIPPTSIGKIIGVAKAYTTRVGGGPFPTELTDVSIAEREHRTDSNPLFERRGKEQ